jgi:type IV pilus assembly protein PilY1
MKFFRFLLLCLMSGLMVVSTFSHADDIDIYSDNAGTTGVPNVLFVMDTGANFSSSAAVPCTAYASGGAPSLGDTAGGVEQCALVDVLEALPADTVNIGILVNNNNSFATDNTRVPNYAPDADPTTAVDAAHEPCVGTYGGCVIRKLALMNAANKTSLVKFIKSWKISGSNSNTEFNVKSGGDRTANTMQEAWAYYNGKLGMSGKNYVTSIVGAGCQKNFVIFIGNSLNNSGGPADGGSESPDNATNGLKSAQAAATAEQLLKITKTVNFAATTCGVTSMTATTTASNWSENWADEWARLMNNQDGASTLDGVQKIVTYTVGVLDNSGSNTCKADYPALLSSMAAAENGGGKYYQTSNAEDVKNALFTILNEIQAVNSVFSSASLPVSVNAQGTYLNQIFLGMFRPDASANPRWLGNLKQYKFILVGSDPKTAVLALGDSAGKEALSSSGTGFITPGAISFWTSKDTATLPDSAGGFYINETNPLEPTSNYLHGHFDSPDGELVERGGAAQQLRLENLTADFAATAGGSSNPRRLYTYCPSGASCQASLTHSDNLFAVSNGGIASNAFGDSTTVAITSIVRTGTSAEVSTSGNHGFTAGTTTVTISNVTQPQYNGDWLVAACAVASGSCFKINGLPDYPTTPSQGAYTISTPGSTSVSVSSISRSTSTTGGLNSETVTVMTSGHSFAAGSSVTITGTTPSAYSGNFTIALPNTGACPAATCFTYSIPVYPTASPLNTYTAAVAVYSRTISTITSTGSNGTATVTTSSAHGFHSGQTVTLASTGKTQYNGDQVITVLDTTRFTFSHSGNPGAVATGSVTPSTTAKTISLSRVATTDSALVTVTGAPANWFGNTADPTETVNIVKASGTAANESEYVANNVTVTCITSTCTSFTYTIATSPSTSISGSSITASTGGASSATIAAGNITRSGTTAKAIGVTAYLFGNAVNATNTVNIAVSGAAFGNETAYIGTWTITCTVADCSEMTFGPVTLTPTSPATGVNMRAFSASTPPDKDSLVKWVRGQDNFGDELGPSGSVPVPSPITVRPSIHGDVLHSRPVVINYGDSSRGLVVYYGANDGVFRAVNGSQLTPIGSVPAGGELWGLVLPEHYNQLNRLRVNSPELLLPSTQLASAQPKDYFVDGSPGVYQKLFADGTVDKAYLYLTMRRGGRVMYALDVSNPTAPTVMWTKSFSESTDLNFSEMGQTWSRPRVTLVKGYANPVLVFGAGYDPAEDAEPPTSGTMGRGIFVLDAVTGARVWSAAYTAASTSCTGSSTQAACAVSGMNWGIAADISFVDRDNDLYTDRFYAADLGGNVWRVDLEPTVSPAGNTPDKWRVTKFAALGCATGTCASGTTPRKFFFPPNVVAVGATGVSGSYDVVMLGAGDREHPLVTHSAYNTLNRFYVLKDTNTGMDAGSTAITEAALVPDPSLYDGTLSGFYTTFAAGEKSVNAPVTVRGTTFYGTNKPTPSATSCNANLGEARGYALDPFKGTFTSTVFDGGGLPPTPTTGTVTITTDDGTEVKKVFCVGCGGGAGADAKSALGAGDPSKKVPKNPRRTYWYKK